MKKDVFEELIVVKRSGQRVNFNSYKIAVVIKHAFDSVYTNYNEKSINKVYADVLNYIETNYTDRKTINVEDIQDIIENKLKEDKHYKVYESFSEYRKKRAASRQVFTIKQQHKFAKAMEKIADNNILNSDNNYTPMDILLKYGKTVSNEFAKSYIIDNKYLRNHEEGNIYIHDIESFPLGMISHTHLILDKVLENGSIHDLINHILKAQNEISGEINITNIDYLLEPWVIKKFKTYYLDYLINYLKLNGFDNYINTKKIIEIVNKEQKMNFDILKPFILSKQVESIFECAYNDAITKTKEIVNIKIKQIILNLDNISITFGLKIDMIGKIINETIINLIEEIDTKNIKFIFKFNNYYLNKIIEPILEGKNIAISLDNEKEYFSNGIRIFENYNDDTNKSNGRMIIGTTSINMARLGLEFKNRSKKEFYQKLDELLELVKNELLLTFETIGNKAKENYEILFTGNILNDEKLESGQKIRKVIKNGNLNIGLVGLKECVMELVDSDKQYKLVLEILKYVNNKCVEFSNETKLNFYICEPISEALNEFMALDKAIYGIKNDNNHYDLISNLDVIKDDFEKIGKIQKLFTGGNVIEIQLKNINQKKLLEIIENCQNNVCFIRFKNKEKICK